jgi:hypothetical protein
MQFSQRLFSKGKPSHSQNMNICFGMGAIKKKVGLFR